ncbi:MAG: acyl-CoA dehydrogenase [Pirellulales bacterium]|nr:acyl-CoA dehydrogenase [Pirellulales bacterium]
MSHEFLFDLRDLQFVLFEHLHAERLFEFEAFREFTRAEVDHTLQEARKFAAKVLAPCNAAGDREGCRWEDGRVYVPQAFHAVYRQLQESGWMAVSTPPEFGGAGLPFCVGAAIGEMFIAANCSLSMIAGLTRTAASLLIEYGDDDMKRRYVPPLVDGRWQGTMCLTEPHAGSAVGALTTSATKRDGKYFLRGQKIFISGGEHDLVENVIHLVLARVEGAPPGIKGVSLFLVPKLRVDAEGRSGESNDVTCVGIEEKLGIHASPTCAMSFGENDNCQAWLIGEENRGIEYMFHMMNAARVGVGLQGVAMGSWAYLAALDYARQRVQGVDMRNIRDPNAPYVLITEHPDVRRMLATMKAYVEGGRALLLHTAFCLDLVENSPDEALRQKMLNRAELLTPICKAYCSDTGFEVATLAVQTLGGHGYLKDYPIEQLLRDVKIASIYEGTNGIQALDLLGRKVGRHNGALFLELMSDLDAFLSEAQQLPVFGPSVATLRQAKQQLENVTMNFAMMQMSGDLLYPLLVATLYLRMFGNVITAWILLEQGLVAQRALERLWAAADVNGDEARAAFCRGDDEGRFYDNKVKTARFFIGQLLPQNDGLAAVIGGGDRSALEMHF